MLRFLAYLLAFTLSACIAYLIYPMVPALIADIIDTPLSQDMYQTLKKNTLVNAAGHTSLTLLVFSLFAYLLPAFIEAIYIGIAQNRLEDLPPSSSEHRKTSIKEFLHVFSDLGFLYQEAQMYSGYLFQDNEQSAVKNVEKSANTTKPANILKARQHKEGNTAPVYASAPAEIVFGKEQLVIGRLPWWLFSNLSKFLIGLGALLAIFSLTGEVLDARPAAGTATSILSIEPALLALAFCLSCSIVIFLTCHLTTDFMKAQVQNLCIQIDNLFFHYENDEHLRQLSKQSLSDGETFHNIMNEQTSKITALLREERRQSLDQTKQAIETLSSSLQKAIQPTLKELQNSSKTIATSQQKQTEKALELALQNFTKNMHEHYGQQAREISAILNASAELVHKMEKNLTKSGQELNTQVSKHHKDLNTQFEKTLKNLENAEKKNQTAALQSLDKFVSTLQSELASNSQSTRDALEQNSKVLVDSQKKLTSTLEKSITSLSGFGRVANDIKAITNGSRDAVDSLALLTAHLQQLENNLTPRHNNGQARTTFAAGPEVISALDDLRKENSRKIAALPVLEI
ncbi:MAG: hypothetical protein CMF31_10915 [Kordiimonas sp.]|nr:hypothetical protein [Kordiimonas sp.]